METNHKKEIIKMNLVMTYPVSWSDYNIASNYVQNFYDALGREDFSRGFHYIYKDGSLTMSADSSFAKEWLFYMGASSKRGTGSEQAGGFGKGSG